VDVSAEILRAMKDIARKGLHCDEFDQVVVAHPAYFDNAQKSETKEAAIRAGFKHVEMISEPVIFDDFARCKA
jgi:molecular chaperone DnaK (HSP70)